MELGVAMMVTSTRMPRRSSKHLIDTGKYLLCQPVLFEQVAETQDGGFIGHEGSTVQPGELP